MPQRFIYLGGWEFVCFVHHCQMQDIRIYDSEDESTCDIMFIVKRDRVMRLMSYKSDPWDYEKDIHGISDKGIFKSKLSRLYLFSGVLGPDPNCDKRIVARSSSSDKIQSCHLMTQKDSIKSNFAFVIQFNDRIATTWLENKDSPNPSYRDLINPRTSTMIKQRLVRGFNEKIIFAHTVDQEDKIVMLDFHPKKHR